MTKLSKRGCFTLIFALFGAILGALPTEVGNSLSAGEKPLLDQWGDSLPRGVVARLGTVRFRHGTTIHSIGFSADGKKLAARDEYGNYILWEVATGRKLSRIEGGPYAFFPDAKALLLRGGGPPLGLLDVGSVKVLQRFREPQAQEEGLRRVLFSPDGRIVASVIDEKPIRLWDVATGKELYQLQGHRAPVCSIAFCRDGKTLGSVDSDGTIRLWNTTQGKEFICITNAKDRSSSLLIFSPDDKIVACAWDRMIGLWSTASGREIRRLPGHEDFVAGMAFTPDCQMLVSAGSWDKTIRVWEVATGRKTREFNGLGGCVKTIALSPDGKTLASGGEDDTIRLWDLASGREYCVVQGHQGIVLSTSFSPDGSTVISGGRDGQIRLWDSVSGKERGHFCVPEAQVYTVAISPDGGTVATGGIYSDHAVRICSVITGQELGRLEHPNSIRSLAFSPAGKTLASGVDDNGVYLWDVTTGRKLRTFRGHEENKHSRVAPGILCLAFSPDGKVLASAGSDDVIIIWDVTTGEERFRFAGHKYSITSLAFSPNGHTLASGSQDDTIRLWEMITANECGRIHVAHQVGVQCLAFSTDGRVLASGGYDKSIHLWDLATCRDTWQFAGHIGPISTVAFSPDGKILASGSEDTTILLWDVYGAMMRQPSPAVQLSLSDLKSLWGDLAGQDASRAYRSLGALVQAGNQTVRFLAKQMRPVPAMDPRRVARLIADLDNSEFEKREQASRELDELNELAEPALRAALADHPTVEIRRRVEPLLKKLEKPITRADQLQAIRAVEVLEKVGSREARDLLKSLAQGAPQARLSREAKQVLKRLKHLPPRR